MSASKALSFTSAVHDWLMKSHRPRVLHVFDHACNLINENRELISVVTPRIGNGPFNLVVEGEVCFFESIELRSPVSSSHHHLTIGNIAIHTEGTELWNPYPDWKILHNQKENILSALTKLPITNYLPHGGFDTPLDDHSVLLNHQHPITQFSNSLISAVASADLPASLVTAGQLAGLGMGLTPSGDDFIMGALYASWIIHPLEIANVLAKEIAEAAAPLTTSLSGAWLRAAGKGEAAVLWHNLFNSLLLPVPSLESPVSQIISTGATSGADALAGFFGVMSAFKDIPHSVTNCAFSEGGKRNL